jgi:hypothetical protein
MSILTTSPRIKSEASGSAVTTGMVVIPAAADMPRNKWRRLSTLNGQIRARAE